MGWGSTWPSLPSSGRRIRGMVHTVSQKSAAISSPGDHSRTPARGTPPFCLFSFLSFPLSDLLLLRLPSSLAASWSLSRDGLCFGGMQIKPGCSALEWARVSVGAGFRSHTRTEACHWNTRSSLQIQPGVSSASALNTS